MRRPLQGLAVVVATTALLAACGGSDADYRADDDLMGKSTSAPSTTATTAPTRTAPADGMDRLAAAKLAKRTLTTWARPDLPYEQWWAGLEPLLTVEAQEQYSYTDPINIPRLNIIGKAVEDREPADPFVTTFYFKTTAGRFGVDVARPPDGGDWRAFSIIFPDSESQRQ